MRKLFLILPLIVVLGCAESAIIAAATGGAGGAGGLAYWLMNQPWMAKICYWVADEASLDVMKDASATVDAGVIGFCSEGVAFLGNAEGLPASQVNATLAANLQSLPVSTQQAIQDAAQVLDDFLPAADSALPLTSNQLQDLTSFMQGWRDGANVCLNDLPPAVQKAIAKAAKEKASLRAKHPAGLKAVKGGWFKPAPVPPAPEVH
jgi:hypothetical protein